MERACLKISPEQHRFFVARRIEFTSETEDGIYHCIGLEKHKQIQNLILDDIKVKISMVRLITLLGYAEKTNDVFALAYTFRPGWNQVCGYFDYSNNKYWY